jgi:hypothetical protein
MAYHRKYSTSSSRNKQTHHFQTFRTFTKRDEGSELRKGSQKEDEKLELWVLIGG